MMLFFLQIEKTSPDGQVTALTGQVNVRDTNDHTPKFVSGRQLLSVDENSPTGTEVCHAQPAITEWFKQIKRRCSSHRVARAAIRFFSLSTSSWSNTI